MQRHFIHEKKARLTVLLREDKLSETADREMNEKLDHDLAALEGEAVPPTVESGVAMRAPEASSQLPGGAGEMRSARGKLLRQKPGTEGREI